METSFFSDEELKKIGFKTVGQNVLISKKASIYQANLISIGNNVRIDDFCVLSGNICIGNYVHIAVYCALFGGNAGITIDDFAGVSSRSVIYAESDDYSGEVLTNPTIAPEFRRVIAGHVNIGKHVIIGSGTTILPGVDIGEGSAVGSMSLVNKSLGAWGICIGIPCRQFKERSRKLLDMEKQFLEKENN